MADSPYDVGWNVCPICGKDTCGMRTHNPYAKNADKSLDRSKTWFRVQCENCHAHTDYYDVRLEAFYAWNRGEVQEEVITNG